MIGGRLVGNRSRLPFPAILSLRSHLVGRRAATALAVIALGASVALASGVELVTRSVSAALARTTEALLGSADLEVTAGDAGIPEELIETLRRVPGVRSASGVIQHTFRIVRGPFENEPIRVVAIDLVYGSEVRSYGLTEGGFTVRDPLRLVANPDSIVLAAPLAQRLQISEGDPVELRSASGESTFHVRGILTGDLAQAFGGQIAVMDLFALQAQLGKGRRVDRIDVSLAPGSDVERVRERIESEVGLLGAVRPSSSRQFDVDSVLAALNTTMSTVALIGILLAFFLTYAVVSLSVDRRMEELALLRAAGMTGSAVSTLVVVDTLLLAAPATLVGGAVAANLSDSLIAVFSRASSYLQHAPIERVQVGWTTLAVAAGVGLGVAMLASIEPALRAGRRSPLDVLRGHRFPPSRRGAGRELAALVIGSSLLATLVFVLGDRVASGPRVALMLASGVVATGAGVSGLILSGFHWVGRGLDRLLPRIGCLVGAALADRPIETGAIVALWAAGVGGLLSLLNLTHSFAVSIDDYYVGVNGPDTVMVFAQDPLASRDRELIRRDVIEQIRGTPGVLDLAEHYAVTVTWRGEELMLESFATRAALKHAANARAFADNPAETVAALLRGELVISETFGRHLGVDVGDVVALATERGHHAFRIGGLARSFTGPTGSLLLDIDTFETWFRPPGSPNVFIWTTEPREEVLGEIHRRVRDQALFFRHGEAFRRHTAHVVAKFNDLAMVPVSVIGTIGVIALTSLLLGGVVARSRDLAVIRASGGSAGNVAALVLAHGFAVGLIGTACGFALGMVWTMVVADVTAQSLRYEVQVHLDATAAVAIASGALALSLAAGVGPALRGRTEVPAGVTRLR